MVISAESSFGVGRKDNIKKCSRCIIDEANYSYFLSIIVYYRMDYGCTFGCKLQVVVVVCTIVDVRAPSAAATIHPYNWRRTHSRFLFETLTPVHRRVLNPSKSSPVVM